MNLRPTLALLAGALLLCWTSPAAAQVTVDTSSAERDTLRVVVLDSTVVEVPADTIDEWKAVPAGPRGPEDPAEVAAFFDGLMAALLDDHHVAGATVAVVRDGQVLLARGYGFADLEPRRRVRAEETLFRIGSISKTFVWTAVMQLVEQGRLDLDADVNTYLKDVQVPEAFGEPITMTHLLTHTPGFEDRVIGLFARDSTRLRPLGEILREEMPARVWPPGQVASYSNHGTGLAALVVEQVSGLSWDAYVEKHILEPLGLGRTTFRQPLPPALRADLSEGYAFEGGEYVEKPFEYVPLAPVGSASTTAADMARYMRAHLAYGRLDSVVVLDSATARTMQSPLFVPGPGTNALAHGFYEMSANGERVIGHGGDTGWFHATMAMLPEHGVGVFAAFNSVGGGAATGGVLEAFLDHYYPAPESPPLEPAPDEAERLARFAGAYRSVRYAHTTPAKLAAGFVTVDVSVTDDGRLKTSGAGGETYYWVRTGPLSFQEVNGLETLAFREEDGEVTHLLFGPLPILAFERIGTLEQPGVQLSLAALALVVLLLAVLGWPLAAWVRRRHGYTLEKTERVPVAGRLLAWGASAALLVFTVLTLVALSNPNEVVYGLPSGLETAFWVARVGLLLAAAALLVLLWSWVGRRGRTLARLWFTLVVLLCFAFLGQLYYWNLLTLP